MNLLEWLAVLLVGVGAVSQGVAGFGFGLVAASAVIAAFGPTTGVVCICLLALVSTIPPLARELSHTRWVDAGIWIAAAVVVTPLLGWALRGVDTEPLSVMSGLVILVGVALLALGRTAAALSGRAGGALAGAVSAAMNLVAGAGGPPVALFAANAGWSVSASRATMLTFFTASNIVTIAVLGLELPGRAAHGGHAGLGRGRHGVGSLVGAEDERGTGSRPHPRDRRARAGRRWSLSALV